MEFRKEDLELHHVGFVVPDVSTAAELFKRTNDVAKVEFYDFRPSICKTSGKTYDNYHIKIAMVTLKNSPIIFELIEPITESGYHYEQIGNTNHINHICYSTKKYDDYYEYYHTLHGEFVFESETEDERIGYRRCFYYKENGVTIEIKEEPYFRK